MLDPIWSSLAAENLVVFLHFHYGLAGLTSELYGPENSGRVPPLAINLPSEITIVFTRLILAGTLDRYPTLKLLLARLKNVTVV